MADDEEKVGKVFDGERQSGSEEPNAPMTTPSATAPSPASAAPSPASAAAKPPPPPPEHVSRVLSADVQKIISKRLVVLGIPEQDREDFQQIACESLLFMANPPGDLDGCKKAAQTITFNKVTDARRHGYRSRKVIVGPTGEADLHAMESARDQVNGHHAQRLATVREAKEDGTLTARDQQMLALTHEGHTHAEIAQQLGVAQQTVSNRIAMVRKKIRELWEKRRAELAALALTIVIAVLVYRNREEVAHFFRAPAPAPVPTHTVPTVEPSIPVSVLQAAEHRSQAAEACRSGDYVTCSDHLEAAARLDPAGETQPTVRELRHLVEDNIRPGREFGAKPGYPR
jgi:RNA polymerase sigma factor (sigma-70 family)